MRQEGVVDRWDAERGFGFIRCEGRSVFFHVRDFRSPAGPPLVGLRVAFEEIHVGTKGPRAMSVRPAGATGHGGSAQGMVPAPAQRRPPARQSASRRRPRTSNLSPVRGPGLMLAWVLVLAWGGWQQRFSVPFLLGLPVLNAATFFAYWLDKDAARRQAWRTSENTLHLLALLGGWPGAWLAQQVLRHKSMKASFRQVYGLTVGLHLLALLAWCLLPWWQGRGLS
jgi:uncharacterized membrane protein YsdA (DUF1294 family)/cold shock CspA family protein